MAELSEYVEKYMQEYKAAHPGVVLVIARSKNENVVVYEAMMDGDRLRESDTCDAYWLDIDPDYVRRGGNARVNATLLE